MLKNVLLVIQMGIAIALIVFVMLQQRGSGVGSTFGGEAVVYRSRRGVEKILYYGTIVTIILLCLISLYLVVLG